MDEGLWPEGQNVTLQAFLKEFSWSFKKDSDLLLLQAIPLTKDIIDSDTNCLTREVP